MAQRIKTISCRDCTQRDICFRYLSRAQLMKADEQRLEVIYRPGEILCKQGTFASHIIYVRKGLVKVYIEGRGKNLILAVVSGGNLIGLTSLFADAIFHYSAMAYDHCEVCLIDMQVFKKFILENASFGSAVIKNLNENTVRSYERIFSMSKKKIPGRFADLLIYFSENIFRSPSFALPFSRKELSDLASMSVESLSRIIRTFNDDDIISVKGRKVHIKNMELLRKVSDNG